MSDQPEMPIENMPLDLTKVEKLRATALMIAVRYHVDTVIKDPEMLRELHHQDKSRELEYLTALKVVETAKVYAKYIRGGYENEELGIDGPAKLQSNRSNSLTGE